MRLFLPRDRDLRIAKSTCFRCNSESPALNRDAVSRGKYPPKTPVAIPRTLSALFEQAVVQAVVSFHQLALQFHRVLASHHRSNPAATASVDVPFNARERSSVLAGASVSGVWLRCSHSRACQPYMEARSRKTCHPCYAEIVLRGGVKATCPSTQVFRTAS
ncbi:hypothetical protein PMIN02_002886 [Paraphaeosphaeria minitans]